MRKILGIVGMILLVSAPVFAETSFVEQVIDGRTLKLVTGERVRLIGVDLPANDPNNPELSQLKQKQATEFMRGLVSGYLVELEFDVQKRDEDGTLLAYVWFEYEGSMENAAYGIPPKYDSYLVKYGQDSSSIFVFLNSTLIKAGYADPLSEVVNVKHTQLFKDIYAKRENKSDMAQATTEPEVQTALK